MKKTIALRTIRTWAAFDLEQIAMGDAPAALDPRHVVELCDKALSKGGDTKMANAKTQKKRAKKAVKKPVKPEKEKK